MIEMYYGVIVLFAVAGILMLGVLASLIYATSSSVRLSTHRARQKGFSELLNYAALVDDGIILGKDGSLSASYYYHCSDADSSSQAEKDKSVLSFPSEMDGSFILMLSERRQKNTKIRNVLFSEIALPEPLTKNGGVTSQKRDSCLSLISS